MIGPMGDELPKLFLNLGKALESEPTVPQLRDIRQMFDSYVLSESVRRGLDRLNDPLSVAHMLDTIMHCKRTAEELRSRRLNARETTRLVGIAGGIGLAAGAVLAALALTTPAVAFIPFLAGTIICTRSIKQASESSEEITVLDQIIERLGELAGT
ncbi:hypothetical protein SAMN05518801_11836 [Novosphingobium sp. CF614]|uniref:hypothetical protein n=1 Tax=Novosphingobium sp. CF614 TaxID=1884364 RepID=UPI0008E867CF|nr:hypothetical protein [Novosphingobium sp. CF614]SFG34774.1 hypothetical protein SAMN05518801_11836 [Novosphingobium sp. CF614]